METWFLVHCYLDCLVFIDLSQHGQRAALLRCAIGKIKVSKTTETYI